MCCVLLAVDGLALLSEVLKLDLCVCYNEKGGSQLFNQILTCKKAGTLSGGRRVHLLISKLKTNYGHADLLLPAFHLNCIYNNKNFPVYPTIMFPMESSPFCTHFILVSIHSFTRAYLLSSYVTELYFFPCNACMHVSNDGMDE